MTLININVVDVAGGYHPGDRVRLRAPSIRGDGSAIISTAWRTVMLEGDGTGSETVSPGPLEVQLDCKGMAESRPILVIVPDQESVTLRSLLEDDFVYAPPVVSEVASLRDQAVEARDRTEVIASAFGSLEGVESEVQAARDAAAAAAGSDTSAAGSASSAAGSAESAEASKVAAAGSAAAAAQSAVNAADSEWVAGEHKGSAETAAAAAAAAETAADGSAVAAAGSATDAATAKTAAESARDESVAAAGSAVADVRLEFDGSVSSAAASAAAAELSAGEALAQADRSSSEADRAEAAAQSASTGVQADTVGKAHLTPELRGELDEKVDSGHRHVLTDVAGLEPALDSKTPFGHTHILDEVDGLDAALAGKADTGHRHSWDQVDGKPVTFPPTIGTTPDTAAAGDHTHTAAEVGAAPAGHSHTEYATTTQVNARTPEIRVVSSPELATSPGVLYVVREG